MTTANELRECEYLLESLRRLRHAALEREASMADSLERVHPDHHESARNLVHYAALRSFDLRDLQTKLSDLGLSSLGRSEASVLPCLSAVSHQLARGVAGDCGLTPPDELAETRRSHRKALLRNTQDLLGQARSHRDARILVTAPSLAATDPTFVRELVSAGMDLLRINCAHDDPTAWLKMVEHVRQAEWETNRTCKILCDLAGPKVRTGPVGDDGTEKLQLAAGDLLWLTRSQKPGRPAKRSRQGGTPTDDADLRATDPRKKDAARIGCTLPAALNDLKVGDRVFFDDGKIGAKVIELTGKGALLRLTSPSRGAKLKADKGINLPDTTLSLPALMPHDKAALDFVVEHAHLVGQSFLRTPEDVEELHRELESRGASHLGVILKVETPTAFARLPDVLLAGLRYPQVGVMVARGDLAVEVGFERLAEAQEEILWMAEAAHVPVIWATQVLESLTKSGMPTRAEVTDAAMSGRAECVMLNKGPYLLEAVHFLDDVLTRMTRHQAKKRAHLRALSISELHHHDAPSAEAAEPPTSPRSLL